MFHHCNQRCLRHTGLGDDQLNCRVLATILLNPMYTEHSGVTIELHHAFGCLNVLKDLGLCHDESRSKQFIPLDYRFINERCYPCAMPGEGILSPTNGRIFVYTMSQSNVQCMTAYFLSRYLAKYVAGIDEGNMIYVAPRNNYAGGKQNITLGLVFRRNFNHAPKVTGSKVNIKKRQKQSKYSKYLEGQAIALTEAMLCLLGYSQPGVHQY